MRGGSRTLTVEPKNQIGDAMNEMTELQDLLQLLGDEALQTLKALAERKRQARAQSRLSEIAESISDKVKKALDETGFDAVTFTYRKTGEGVEVRFVRSAGRSTGARRSSEGPMADKIQSVRIGPDGAPVLVYKDGSEKATTWTVVKDEVLGWTNRANSNQIKKALRARGLLID